jgi:hypothetical protein
LVEVGVARVSAKRADLRRQWRVTAFGLTRPTADPIDAATHIDELFTNSLTSIPAHYPRGVRALVPFGRRLAATGRGWRHPPSTCEAAGAWEESGMARDPGGLGQSLTVDRQQWRSAPVGRPCGSRPALGSMTGSDPSPQRWRRNSGVGARGLTAAQEPGADQKLAQDTRRRRRGGRKATRYGG